MSVAPGARVKQGWATQPTKQLRTANTAPVAGEAIG